MAGGVDLRAASTAHLSAAMLSTDRAVPESAYFLFKVNLRRFRRASSHRCESSRGSPSGAAVVGVGVDPRARGSQRRMPLVTRGVAAAWRSAAHLYV